MPAETSVVFMTSWTLFHNVSMVYPSPDFLTQLNANLKSYLMHQSYVRYGNDGNLVVAPTYLITKLLMFILADGMLPNLEMCEERNPASLADACIVATMPASGKKRFQPPSKKVHNISVQLCVENALRSDSKLFIMQGAEACNFVATFATKFPEDVLRIYLTDEQIHLISNPMGRTSEKSSEKWGLFFYDSNVFANIPSVTNMVAYSTQAVSKELRQRLAESASLIMFFLRSFAKVSKPNEKPVRGIDILDCIDHGTLDSLLNKDGNSESLSVSYVPPCVSGRLAAGL